MQRFYISHILCDNLVNLNQEFNSNSLIQTKSYKIYFIVFNNKLIVNFLLNKKFNLNLLNLYNHNT